MEELKIEESKIINILEKEIEELTLLINKLSNKLAELSEKANNLDIMISGIIDYDTYVCGVIDRAKKIIREFSL
jgi:prefoldin subunit 5